MTHAELVVIVVGSVVGFGVVSFLIQKPKVHPPATLPDPLPDHDAHADASLPWHKVLGVDPMARIDSIYAAHHALKAQYDPLQVASLGPELRALAERKSKALDDALRDALDERGHS